MSEQTKEPTVEMQLLAALSEYGERKARGQETAEATYRVFDIATVAALDLTQLRAAVGRLEGERQALKLLDEVVEEVKENQVQPLSSSLQKRLIAFASRPTPREAWTCPENSNHLNAAGRDTCGVCGTPRPVPAALAADGERRTG
jgi:hypothetical protein